MTQKSPVGRVISSISLQSEDVVSLFEKYLHDFIRLVYYSKQEESKMSEYEVCVYNSYFNGIDLQLYFSFLSS